MRINIINPKDNVSFKKAYGSKELVDLNELQVVYIGLRDFIQNKEAVGRTRDLSDIKKAHEKQRKEDLILSSRLPLPDLEWSYTTPKQH